MNEQTLAKYRNLAQLTQEEWQSLDVHLFILANCDRYGHSLLRRIGLRHLPNDALDILPGLFCDVGFRPLKKLHSENLDSQGERRNQLMLGTLKQIAATRMIEAVIREFPSYVSLSAFDDEIERLDAGLDADWNGASQYSALATTATAFYAASSEDTDSDERDQDLGEDERRLSAMLEQLRAHLTPTQYKHLRLVVCDRLDYQEVAAHTGHSVTNVRSVLLNARKRLLEFVPEQATLHNDALLEMAG